MNFYHIPLTKSDLGFSVSSIVLEFWSRLLIEPRKMSPEFLFRDAGESIQINVVGLAILHREGEVHSNWALV